MIQSQSSRIIKLFLFFTLLFSLARVNAQDENFKRKIPPFHIQLSDGDSLLSTDLKKNTQVMIVYFDPTCEHCQAFTRDILKKIHAFDHVEIVYITYTPLSEVQKFVKDFGLNKYANFKVGTEGDSFVVQKFYYVSRFPFIALYDKQGMLLTFYRMPPTAEVLSQKFQSEK